ncbi:MAG: response regulator [Candidatus Glassbacteria bacterium]|nr:response regulator [Candidatus Glassbacteria bacterium]
MAEKEEKLILVIDDDRDMLEAIKIMLESAGFAVGLAVDGKQGLEKVEELNPDLIIVDMMMETVDAGVKVAEKIKKMKSAVPIFLLSSIGEATSYNLDTSAIGFAGVIQKPLMPSMLIPLLRKKLHIA